MQSNRLVLGVIRVYTDNDAAVQKQIGRRAALCRYFFAGLGAPV